MIGRWSQPVDAEAIRTLVEIDRARLSITRTDPPGPRCLQGADRRRSRLLCSELWIYVTSLDGSLFRDPYEVRDGVDSQLVHHAAAVDLDGLFNRPKIAGNLVVELSCDNMRSRPSRPASTRPRRRTQPCHHGARGTLAATYMTGVVALRAQEARQSLEHACIVIDNKDAECHFGLPGPIRTP